MRELSERRSTCKTMLQNNTKERKIVMNTHSTYRNIRLDLRNRTVVRRLSLRRRRSQAQDLARLLRLLHAILHRANDRQRRSELHPHALAELLLLLPQCLLDALLHHRERRCCLGLQSPQEQVAELLGQRVDGVLG